MIRFAWLQFRTQAAVVALALLAVAAAGLFHRNNAAVKDWLGVLVLVAPGLIGMFWGAPLVAGEFEDGTFRLAWTQSVTRTRWLAVKLAVAGLASMAAAGLLSLVVTWWSGPLDRAALDQFATFDQRDIVPVGYAAFAFTLGVVAGALIRRTRPAMFLTLAIFVATRLVVFTWVRQYLFSPVLLNLALNPGSTGYGQEGLSVLFSSPMLMPNPPDLPNTWITSIRIVNAHGQGLTTRVLDSECPGINQGRRGGGLGHTRVPQAVATRLQDCVAKIGTTYHEALAYQPASHYWPLQWCELAIFLGAALALAAAGLWRAASAAPGCAGRNARSTRPG
jgi:hypothetical protein